MSNFAIEPDFSFFKPKDYLKEYYSSIGEENNSILNFYHKIYKDISNKQQFLEFGGGPTIYQLISAVKYISEIFFSDYLESNLQEVKLWLSDDPEAFDWDPFVKRVLEIEGVKFVRESDIYERKKLIHSKIKKLFRCNAFSDPLLEQKEPSQYDIVSSNFVAESISRSIKDWKIALANICSLVKPNGYLVVTAILGASYWHAGERKFPAVNISKDLLLDELMVNGFSKKTMEVESIVADNKNAEGKGSQGYSGLLFVKAQKIDKI